MTAREADPASTAEALAETGAAALDLTPTVGANLRRLRTQRGLSLEKLAQRSGVSRAMLGQIELGQSAPTINVLWKIARSLDVTFSALITAPEAGGVRVMRAKSARILASQDGSFRSRALFPLDSPRRTEFYELRLAPRGAERADAHAPGTLENLTVSHGSVHIVVGGERYELAQGDAMVFPADGPHSYENPSEQECVLYLVITYAEPRT